MTHKLECAPYERPTDPEARRALAVLDGKLQPQDIVDPDRMPAQAPPVAPRAATARRFVCPSCGGRMEFAPDGNVLACAYCGNRQSVISAIDQGAVVEEGDFVVALATAKGHTIPVATQALKCSGCGASFVLSPGTVSTTCPYCASAYVVEQPESLSLIPPEAIVPFAITQEQAQAVVMQWYRSQGFRVLAVRALPAGVYLPAWAFDIGGELAWRCETRQGEEWVTQEWTRLVYEKQLTVAASHSLSAPVADEINAFPLDRLKPYDPGFLADWPAETYQISVSEASLVARSRTFARERPEIQAGIDGTFRDLHLDPTRMVVETFKLILVPMWIARYRYEQKWYLVAVNGQNGHVRGDLPQQAGGGWLSSLMREPS
ncbi:MAG: hypothetical protein M1482_11575 [Chloroflexi bacterium]|nr:hypothetical protein [Chloroflexota bacterium]